MATVFGRQPELALVHEFLSRLPDAQAGMLVLGKAGIGKTTLWAVATRSEPARVGLRQGASRTPAPGKTRVAEPGAEQCRERTP